MKNKNAFVSQKEVVLDANVVLVTKTDTKGIITYTNDAFCEIAGYTREELIGKSHNIVRHPDMPPAAFKWLWDTLKAERPWRGMVKNRCKNGDHYWVLATVATLLDDGKVVGYVSVRRAPSRAQIAEAEALYRGLNQSGAEVVSKYEKYKFVNWSLRAKLQTLVQATLLIVLTSAQIFMANTLLDEMQIQALKKGDQLASEVIDSANLLMVVGQISEAGNRQLLMKKITSGAQVKSVQLVRAQPVISLYGPGLAEEKISTDLQRRVIQSGKAESQFYVDVDGKEIFRVVTPYLAHKDFHGTDCTGCHQVAENTVLGASDIAIDLSSDYARFWRTELETALAQLMLHIFLLIFIGYVIRRYVTDPAQEIHRCLRDTMGGKLDAELAIDAHDEVGGLLCDVQTLQCYLRTLVNDIASSVRVVNDKVSELRHEVGREMTGVEVEQDRIQAIAATMEEFSQSIAEVANMAADSKAEAERAQAVVAQNEQNMALSMQVSDKVAAAVQQSSVTIAELGEAIGKVGLIANTIKEIADQTNLLALNAAIEAARAGEQGRGFAVVADEVRKLAERTATSTKDIATTITAITEISNAAVKTMSEAVREVQSGAEAIQQNSTGLKAISTATKNVLEHTQSIANATHEQSVAGQDVANTLEKITGLVDSNTAALQNISHTTEELSMSADKLSKAGYPLTKCELKI